MGAPQGARVAGWVLGCSASAVYVPIFWGSAPPFSALFSLHPLFPPHLHPSFLRQRRRRRMGLEGGVKAAGGTILPQLLQVWGHW